MYYASLVGIPGLYAFLVGYTRAICLPVCVPWCIYPPCLPVCVPGCICLPCLPITRFTVGRYLKLPTYTRFTVGRYLNLFLHPFHCWASSQASRYHPFHCWASSQASLPPTRFTVGLVLRLPPTYPFHWWARIKARKREDTPPTHHGSLPPTRVYMPPYQVIYAC